MNRIDTATDKAITIIKAGVNRVSSPTFNRNPSMQKWIILVIMSFVLSLMLTPQIHYNPTEYKLGMIAPKDIKADRNFLVEERTSTDLKRAEVVREVPSVFDRDMDMAYQLRVNLTKAFLTMEEAYRWQDRKNSSGDSQPVMDNARKEFEKTLGIVLTGEEFNILSKYRFSPDIAGKIAKLVTDLHNTELITNVSFLKQDIEKGIIIRDAKTQNEERHFDLSDIWQIKDLQTLLQKKTAVILARDRSEIRRIAVSLTARLIQPNLTFNKTATEKRRQMAVDSVKPVLFQVQNNEMIIREGEKITQTDLDKLEAFYRISRERQLTNLSIFVGLFSLIMLLSATLYSLAKRWLKKPAKANTDMLFLSTVVLLQFILIRAGIFISEAVNRAFPFLPIEASYFAIPFAVGSMLVGYLIMRKMALIFTVFMSFLVAFLFDHKISMTLFSFLGSVAAAYYIAHCRQRSAFFRAGLFLGIVNGVVILSLNLMAGEFFSLSTLVQVIMGGIGGMLSGVFVAGITPLFESLFEYMTDIKLLELANLNQPIFQRMIIEAPGTYHHSVLVASMVEAAAEAIGANSLLVKVSAYYHDVGKLKKPQYYIENQPNGENRHERLTPKMSSLVIISHVKEGCELASQARLGKEIINIIREHHGTSLVNYFYEKAKKDKDPSIRALPESDFRYPGPKPQTKEAGLVLLGDMMEASSRTLSNPTPARISNLVRERIEKVFMDGQLDECELTLRDLNKIADSFIRILNGIFHHRIDYPEPVLRDFGSGRKAYNGSTDRKPPEKGKNRYPSVTAGSS